ncbi:MAG TPA: ABC transporter substrate-binding protein [Chloroflexota bacterium]
MKIKQLACGLSLILLAGCGGTSAIPASSISASALASASPASSKPAASASAPASAKPAPSAAGSAKPAASAAPIQKATLQLAKPLPPLNPAYTVKARVGNSLTTAPFWYAIEKGYLDQLGLKFDQVNITNASDVVGPLVSGQLDIAGTSFGPGIYNAVQRGVDVVAVADNGQLQPSLAGSAAIVKKGNLAQYGQAWCALKGKKVGGIDAQTGLYPTLIKALESCKLTINDVDFFNPTFPALNQAIVNGAGDVGFQVEPFVSQGVAAGLVEVWHPLDQAWANQQMNLLMYGPGFTRNKDAALRFMVAYLAGVRDYDRALKPGGNQAEMYQILAKYLADKNPDHYAQMIMMGINSDGQVNLDATRQELQIFQQAGTVPAGDVKLDWITNDVRQQALDYLGPR